VGVSLFTNCLSRHEDDERFFGINLDITGCERLFQGEEALLKKLSEAFNRFRLQHRLVVAPSLGSAWALSRYGEKGLQVVEKNSSFKSFILPLQIEALRLSPKDNDSLKELLILTIGELIKLPRKSLLERYGRGILERLDQLFGLQQEPIHPIRVLTLSRADKIFEGAVLDNETIKMAAWELLQELLQKLQKNHQQPTQIVARLKTVPGPIISKELSLSLPTYNQKHIARMLERKLDTVRAPFGIERLTLLANRTEQFTPALGQFLALRSTDPDGERYLGELIDNLIQNLGREQLLVPEAQATYLPEATLSLKTIDRIRNSSATLVPIPKTDRPSLLLNRPQPIRAMATLPDGPPFWLKWREKTYQITRAIGPERLSPEWWKEQSFTSRDYFKVQIPSGTWLWVFRELESSRWFLQGMWS
jgi:protein ImuB